MDELEKLRKELESLPNGYISNKKINGKIRHYLQRRVNGKTVSCYIPDTQYEDIKSGIERRKELQALIKAMELTQTGSSQDKAQDNKPDNSQYNVQGNVQDNIQGNTRDSQPEQNGAPWPMRVSFGQELKEVAEHMSPPEKRKCFIELEAYLYGPVRPRICALFGLRRTGKTTMIYQAISGMTDEAFAKAAYIMAEQGQDVYMLDACMKRLKGMGFKYVFIDEVTYISEFIDTACFLSDIYAAAGMKIVLSGTDSLGFWLASYEKLYDRADLIHTSWIPFAEHSRLLGTDDVDDYLEHGGILTSADAGNTDRRNRENLPFRNIAGTQKYITSAIAENIQHSLRYYDDGNHFRHLRELYEKDELINAINRVIEDMNHRFAVSVITDSFKSSDPGAAKKLLITETNEDLRTDLLARIDSKEVTDSFMKKLGIKNKEELTVPVTESHVYELKEYLKGLELMDICPVKSYKDMPAGEEKVLITQPGLRYSQVEALISCLVDDFVFSSAPYKEREYICGRIMDEVKGRMLEEMVLYETMMGLGDSAEVFKFMFARGEIDMVVYLRDAGVCRLYEIKHSKNMVPEQTRHLLSPGNCSFIEQRVAPIAGRYVLYRGDACMSDTGVQYLNVAAFLKGLPQSVTG